VCIKAHPGIFSSQYLEKTWWIFVFLCGIMTKYMKNMAGCMLSRFMDIEGV